MSFFDSKEEVISIELTDYGKEIFSKGLFDPKYYAFYDDDIIYDSTYYGIIEDANEIETRILEQSIYLKPVYNFSDRQKNLKNKIKYKNTRTEKSKSVGTVNSSFNYTPSWHFKVLEGTSIKNTYYHISAPDILQIDLEVANIVIDGESLEDLEFSIDNILIELEENNIDSNKNNFEIEFFEITDKIDSDGNKILDQFYFAKDDIYVKNDILLDKPIIFSEFAQNDDRYSEYYFDINTDKAILPSNINNIKKTNKKLYNFEG